MKKNFNLNQKNLVKTFSHPKWIKEFKMITVPEIEPKIQVPFAISIVYVLVDCSSSMSAGNKMLQAKEGSLGFAINAITKRYLVGLVKFDTTAELLLEPQQEIESMRSIIEKMNATGSTNMSDAIQITRNKLTDKSNKRVICIVTDGEPDNKIAALNEANKAKQMGIDIMTIGTDDADKEFLENLATCKELSSKVVREQLKIGIVSMAKLLPSHNG